MSTPTTAQPELKTLNEIQYGCKPEDMGTTGLIDYVRGPHWPYVPESTCFSARMELACEIIAKRNSSSVKTAVERFRKAVNVRLPVSVALKKDCFRKAEPSASVAPEEDCSIIYPIKDALDDLWDEQENAAIEEEEENGCSI